MLCVCSNPVREAFVIYSVIMLQTRNINRQQAEAAAAAVRNLFPNLKCVHARTGMGQVPHLGLLPARLRSQAERRRQRQGSGHSADELHCPHQCPAGTQEGGHGRELTH